MNDKGYILHLSDIEGVEALYHDRRNAEKAAQRFIEDNYGRSGVKCHELLLTYNKGLFASLSYSRDEIMGNPGIYLNARTFDAVDKDLRTICCGCITDMEYADKKEELT